MTVVEQVRDRRGLQEFFQLSWRVYRDDPLWVPPLLRDLYERLSPRNPFFKRADITLLLAYQGREVIGRLAVILDPAYCEHHAKAIGCFGLFECLPSPEAAAALFDAARAILREHRMTLMQGPMNPSINDECGLLIEGFQAPPRLMMSYNPPYYQELLEGYGLRKVKDLYAYDVEVPAVLPDRITRVAEEARRQGVKVRPVNLQRFEEEITLIREIYNEAWSSNWGFLPLSEEEILFIARRLKPLVVPELALIAELHGVPVGFMLSLPDYNQVLKHLNGRLGPFSILKFLYHRRRITAIRLMAFGVRPKHRRRGTDALLYFDSFRACRRLGYRTVEVSWILEDNLPTRRAAERWGGKVSKRYRIYEMGV